MVSAWLYAFSLYSVSFVLGKRYQRTLIVETKRSRVNIIQTVNSTVAECSVCLSELINQSINQWLAQ